MTKQQNIFEFPRTTGDANGNAIAMNDLTYSYKNGNTNSNLLTNVSDAVSNQNTGGFVDGNTTPSLDDYEYDLNGNMIKDRNKGIESIVYNHLNLPVKVTWTNKKQITYQYNAAGQKLKKTVRDNDSIKIVEYLDGFQYAGERLQFFPHAEGYVKVSSKGENSLNMFNYVFNYTDHLGNVRISYTKDPQTNTLKILDEDHYYPFGLKHSVYVPSSKREFKIPTIGDADTPTLEQVRKTEYQYKYQGQERQDELGLNWDSFKWRNYDYTIGRFFNHDPLSEKYVYNSPYAFQENKMGMGRELEGLELIEHPWKSIKNKAKSANNALKSTSISGISLGLSAGFQLSDTGLFGSISEFNYNFKENEFSFSALKGFLGLEVWKDTAKAEVDVAYSSKNFESEKSEAGFIRIKGSANSEGTEVSGELVVFGKNKDDQRGAILIESGKNNTDERTTDISTPQTDTKFKLKLGFGLDFSFDNKKFEELERQGKNEK